MKNLNLFVGILLITLLTAFSCEKPESKLKCYSAKVLKKTCGGTIIQFLTKDIIGEEWKNVFTDSQNYQNCVLAGNIPEKTVEGDTLYFDYEQVSSFSGGNYCDIGGLPSIKIEIQVNSDKCLN